TSSPSVRPACATSPIVAVHCPIGGSPSSRTAPARRTSSRRSGSSAPTSRRYHGAMHEPRLVLITGAAGAIGAALAHALAFRHPEAHLALCDLDAGGLARIAGELGGRASTWRWDLSDPEALATRWGTLVAAHGPVDVL